VTMPRPLTPGARRALEALRTGPATPGKLALMLWPQGDLLHTSKTAAGQLGRLRADGFAARVAPGAYEYRITRAGYVRLILDAMLRHECVVLDGKAVFPSHEAVPPCREALCAKGAPTWIVDRLKADKVVMVSTESLVVALDPWLLPDLAARGL